MALLWASMMEIQLVQWWGIVWDQNLVQMLDNQMVVLMVLELE